MADDGDKDLLELLGGDVIVQAIKDWADKHSDEFLAVVKDGFDADQQLAVKAMPSAVQKIKLQGSKLFARVDFDVTYKSPLDAEDRELSAENAASATLDVVLEAPFVEQLGFDDFVLAPEGIFPT